MYFQGVNFYLIGEGGGKGGKKLSDADSRITQDLNTTIGGFSRTFSTSIFSLTAGFCESLPRSCLPPRISHTALILLQSTLSRSTAYLIGSTPSRRIFTCSSPTSWWMS